MIVVSVVRPREVVERLKGGLRELLEGVLRELLKRGMRELLERERALTFASRLVVL